MKKSRGFSGKIQFFFAYTVLLVFVLVCGFFISFRDYSIIADSLSRSLYNDLVTQDFRSAIVGLGKFTPEPFSSVAYYSNGRKDAEFYLPADVRIKSSSSDSSFDTLKVDLQGSQGTLIFGYPYWRGPFAAFFAWLVFVIGTIPLIIRNNQRLKRDYDEQLEKRQMRSRLEIASQVAHDIRSPLAALESLMGGYSDLPEERRTLLRNAVSRIKDITNDLQSIGKPVKLGHEGSLQGVDGLSFEIELLSAFVEIIMTEKRIQYRSKIGIEIESGLDKNSYGIFVKVDQTEFKRLLSNLINNSVEALKDNGRIIVKLASDRENAILTVNDNGPGIPSEILAKLGNRGETHGKVGGSGLGIYHAKSAIEAMGGTFHIESALGVGTTVTLTLPKADPPKWFVPDLKIAETSLVVVLDDDTSIHQIWKGRLESVTGNQNSIKTLHFATGRDLIEWYQRESSNSDFVTNDALYLCDYELIGQNISGLDVIEKLGIASQSILVTSRYEEPNIRESCERLGVKLIPKGLAGMIPIFVVKPLEILDAVLLDDDELVAMSWSYAAKQNGKSIRTFDDPKSFFAAISSIDRSTPVFIDSNLKDGIKGQDLISKVTTLGFRTIYLATGYDSKDFTGISGLTGIVGKNPPKAIGG